ncbi:MAG: 3-hydroxybutyryl-CoA dehydrogenase [Bacteroidia bacterium]|jgi:3-hydroxybutyryl-CoA dehydrogenase|nr:3-hydroxybutyryl-CoA dehydrogenase [Bacteroidia bacterium]
MKDIKTIAIAGAGTMGAGIAQVTANAGFKTILFDINQTVLDKAKTNIDKGLQFLVDKGKLAAEKKETTLSLLHFTTNINDIIADLIIEAVVERLDIKHDFFNKVAAINAPDCILASNTSSIPITQIAAKIPNPERVIGIHFFNPAPIMKLVEIIIGAQSNKQVALHCKAFIESMGKTCVMAADAPGFIVNRVARNYYVEGLKILEEQVATFEDIDALLESSGFKMGPFKLMDLIGVDTNLSVTTSMYNLFNQDPKFRPNRIQQQKVDAGLYGRKTGKGFYEY